MIMISDGQGVVTYFNRRWHEFTGQPPFFRDAAEYWRTRIHPDDVAYVAEQWKAAVERKKNVSEMTYRLRNAGTGRFHRVFARALAIRNDAGDVVQWIGTAMDLEDSDTASSPAPVAVSDTPVEGEALARVTVTLRASIADRLHAIRDAFNLSVSSIVEHAVDAYLERGRTDELAEDLRARGASRRRRSG
jgi:hypothetical protein